MNKALQILIKLQTIEDLIETREKDLKELPKTIVDLENKLKTEKDNLEKLRKKDKELELTKRAKEKYLEELSSKVSDRKSKLFKVKTNEEYSALLKEIENLKQEISKTEDEVILILYEIEENKEAIKLKEREITEISKLLEDKKGELNKKLRTIEEDIERLKQEKEEIIVLLDEKLKETYYKLKETKKKAVVTTKDRLCTGCYMNIPLQVFIEVKKSTDIVTCPQCGRILYWEESETGESGNKN